MLGQSVMIIRAHTNTVMTRTVEHFSSPVSRENFSESISKTKKRKEKKKKKRLKELKRSIPLASYEVTYLK